MRHLHRKSIYCICLNISFTCQSTERQRIYYSSFSPFCDFDFCLVDFFLKSKPFSLNSCQQKAKDEPNAGLHVLQEMLQEILQFLLVMKLMMSFRSRMHASGSFTVCSFSLMSSSFCCQTLNWKRI